ncbi:exportin-2-like [Patiria miniata]|uniref:Exportin-2 n=1 Tax=Patiria miniata TaxID=46514 RepID=A0A914A219_PATMI|nr:exportin-2-like [Patiria miniata]XP_038057673.1 exportin-2-like [Patiria miniata]XP_038057674.1 exportin-2-like [Patiria miniata]XP_038057675.1 exportin-2-like [Patiria miniata]
MELTTQDLYTVASSLQQTLSANITERRAAEAYLESVEARANYSIFLLELLSKDDVDSTIRISAAVTFKNFVRRNWRVVEDEPNKINDADRGLVKDKIVELMLGMPENLQRQLSEAISIIGLEDFPQKWHKLLEQMKEKLGSDDYNVINGILRTAHSLFKRYRHEFKSQELWTEIKMVLDKLAEPLTILFEKTVHLTGVTDIKTQYDALVLMCKVFYSLNCQDLPEYFEDNMNTWMTNFLKLVSEDVPALHTKNEEEAGTLERLKSQICDNIALYAQKYDEEFGTFLPQFVTAVWHLLVTTGKEVKYDLLVSNAIQFLASVADRAHYKDLFEKPEVLTSICEKVIVPNMEFRASDEELFEFNPEEYIRRDIEGSDIDTRRRSACDLVKSLCKFFEATVTQIFSSYVGAMLELYASNPTTNWKSKDAAIYLVTSLASKSKTQKHGTTEVRQLVNINDFFTAHIASDLQSDKVDEFPVLKADAIKYVMAFRQIIPAEVLSAAIPCLITLLRAESTVVHTYAAHAIERLFTVKLGNGHGAISVESVKPHIELLLTNLFAAMEFSGSEENEYIMKAIMRSLVMLKAEAVPYLQVIVAKLTEKLLLVSKNPSKPHFNHYLFEAISLSVRSGCQADASNVSIFEMALFPPFQDILTADIGEFIPYVFQIMSLMLEMHTDCPAPYMVLFPHLLTPVLWEKQGNIPPLVRLIQAYIEKGSADIVKEGKVLGILGVFQKLISSKANDHQGFYVMQSLLEHMEASALSEHIHKIFLLLFQRLTHSKTTKFVKSLLVFFSLFAVKHGADSLVRMIEEIQAKMFGMVLEKLYIPEVQKVSGHLERKICAVGITKILTECPAMFEPALQPHWTNLLQALVHLFELPEDDSLPDDEHFIEIEDTPGYQTAYSQLAFAGKHETDPFRGAVPDAKIFLAQGLKSVCTAHPELVQLIKTGLDEKVANCLQVYLTAAHVTLG